MRPVSVIAGDVLGQITAAILQAEVVVTPVSSNTGVEASGRFAEVIRTQIGSPFVIAGMEQAGGEKVVGYEANGGFLLGFAADLPAGGWPRLRRVTACCRCSHRCRGRGRRAVWPH